MRVVPRGLGVDERDAPADDNQDIQQDLLGQVLDTTGEVFQVE